MDDRTLMEGLLLEVKGVCDLYMHGSIESSTSNVHSTFNCALNDCIKMQNDIYSQMSQKGWYPTEQAQQTQIDKVKNTYANG